MVRELGRVCLQPVERGDHFAMIGVEVRIGAAAVWPHAFGAPGNHEVHKAIAYGLQT